VISAATHIARLVRAAYVFAREGVFGVVDPSLVPPPGQLALRLARLIERPGAKSGPRLSRALTRLGPAYLKLGQFLATRPDVVGVAMARDLESLQDRLPPFSQTEAEAVIATSLERPVAQAFWTFGSKRPRCPRWPRTRATIRISACRPSTGIVPPTTF
jgi:ubiquinone biosynthesis protein